MLIDHDESICLKSFVQKNYNSDAFLLPSWVYFLSEKNAIEV